MGRSKVSSWIEATRPRTLPVSIAGVLAGCAVANFYRSFHWLPAIICLLFALGAQIVSNFANEYYDFKSGIDSKGREGFRRGVTEGDISPKAMKRATFSLLALTGLIGCSLIYWGGWWLLPVGLLIALFALAYSAGPWPLSRHGLGDVAVIIFFGIVPVMLTAWLQCGSWTLTQPGGDTQMWLTALLIGIATGMMADNVLIVNNYRDMDADRAVGKRTTVVIFGRRTMAIVYALFWVIAAILMMIATDPVLRSWRIANLWIPFGCMAGYFYRKLTQSSGSSLNGVLALTARFMLLSIVYLLITSFFRH
ncbi:MAG: 1,4-dihydroxy-2-naphthoate octaprenyltransferase [Muribaculaceae bacterium]|nr:1,4-dihydroxy-2-naphthoate octaprenyltransferase [Muribaculaceae bacterium]